MSVLVSTMTQKGQVTIPKDVRESLHLVTGDKVEFVLNDRNEIVIKPVNRKVMEVAGLLSKYKRSEPISIEEMSQCVEQSFEDEKL